MQLVNIENVPQSNESAGALRSFLSACTTFGSNIVERFHEYADARLAEELTIVEQRRRLLSTRQERPAIMQRTLLVHRTGQID